MTFEVHGHTFPTKQAVIEECRAILYRYKHRECLSDEDAGFVFDLLLQHPHADVKIGDGVTAFHVREFYDPPSRCFWIVRADGSETDFSFLKCLRQVTPLQRFKQSARRAVAEDIIAFKKTAFSGSSVIHCALTGAAISGDDAHVDHSEPTFDEIVRRFICAEQIDPQEVAFLYPDGMEGTSFADPLLETRFRQFHREHAHLRMVTAQANLRRPRGSH